MTATTTTTTPAAPATRPNVLARVGTRLRTSRQLRAHWRAAQTFFDSYSPVPGNPFTVPGNAAGLLDLRKKASANGGVPGPVITVSVPAYTVGPAGNFILELGQSNLGGKAEGSDLAIAPLSNYQLTGQFANYQAWNPHVGAYQSLEHLVNDLTLSDSIDCGTTPPGGGAPYGSDLFGHNLPLALRLQELFPNRVFYGVKKTADGQPIASMLAGGGWKADLYSRLANAKAAMQAQGVVYKCAVVIVHFGETDAANGTDYAQGLVQLQAELLQAGYVDGDTVFVQVGLKHSPNVNALLLQRQVAQWAAADPAHRKVTDSASYQGKVGDLLHLNGVTQMQIGHSDIPTAWLGVSGGFRITLPVATGTPAWGNYAPTTGPVGTLVRLFGGGNFGSNTTLDFSGPNNTWVPATIVQRESISEFYALVPQGAISGQMRLGNGPDYVLNSASYPFTVTP